MWSVDYSDSSSSGEEQNEDQNEKESTLVKKKNTDTSTGSFNEKFERLKQRRILLSSTSSSSSSSRKVEDIEKKTNNPTATSNISNISKQNAKKKNSEKRGIKRSHKEQMKKLDEYIPLSYELTDAQNLNKKKRIEMDLDEAIKEKDFDRAQEISDEITRRQLATQVKGAFDAQKFAKIQEEKEAKRKRKQRKKLKWAFDHKERWETKGNM